jgi:SpoVK/Ycf46/Vps4 family AAA+-type ATPase
MTTASARILQLVRAHYRGDEQAFAGAATQLARAAKSDIIRRSLTEAIREGYSRRPRRRSEQAEPRGASKIDQCGLLQSLPALGFADLLLDPDAEALLQEIAIELEYREPLSERGLRPRSRLLFWGPPGNGKSSAGAAMAAALGVRAYAVSIPRLIDGHVGATGQNLAAVFEALGPDDVVVFDELDAVGSTRGTVDQAASKEFNAIVNTMLTLLDRHEDGVLIATTNRPDIIDPALLRRFDEQIKFPSPTRQQKRLLAERLCDAHQVDPVAVDDCENFDAVTKRVRTEARRAVMAELLAADAADEQEDNESGEKEAG